MREDSWLAERLGRPAFTLDGDDTDAPPGFAQAKVDCGDVARVRALEANGFRIVDVNVTLRREPAPLSAPNDVRAATPEDRAAIVEIAEQELTTSRFHLDPEIPEHTANAIKRDWAAALADGTRGERLLVAGRDGFLALLAGSVIDLIAVRASAQRKGIGRALVAAVAHERLTVGTQASNLGALRFYERLGFETVATRYVLHRP